MPLFKRISKATIRKQNSIITNTIPATVISTCIIVSEDTIVVLPILDYGIFQYAYVNTTEKDHASDLFPHTVQTSGLSRVMAPQFGHL